MRMLSRGLTVGLRLMYHLSARTHRLTQSNPSGSGMGLAGRHSMRSFQPPCLKPIFATYRLQICASRVRVIEPSALPNCATVHPVRSSKLNVAGRAGLRPSKE